MLHLAAVFFGVLLFCNGVSALVLTGMFIDTASLDDPCRQSGLRRWGISISSRARCPAFMDV
jgi:hypothetical protein